MCIACVLVFTDVPNVSAQQLYEDVVYLRDGSILRGVIIEQIPDESLKIQIEGGSVMVCRMSNVQKITKELHITQTRPVSRKQPAVAFALSFFVPGAGQAYNNEMRSAITHFGIAVGSYLLLYTGIHREVSITGYPYTTGYSYTADEKFVLGALCYLVNWGTSMITAPISARQINKRIERNRAVSVYDDRLLLEPYTEHDLRGAMLSLRF